MFESLPIGILHPILQIFDCINATRIDPEIVFSTIRYLQKYYAVSKNPNKNYFIMSMSAFHLSTNVNEFTIPIKNILKQLNFVKNKRSFIRNFKELSNEKISDVIGDNFKKSVENSEMDLIFTLNFDFFISNPLFISLKYINIIMSWHFDIKSTEIDDFINKKCASFSKKVFTEILPFSRMFLINDNVISLLLAKFVLVSFGIPIGVGALNRIFEPSINDYEFEMMYKGISSYIDNKCNVYDFAQELKGINVDKEITNKFISYPIECASEDGEPLCPPPDLKLLESFIFKSKADMYCNSYTDHIPNCPPPPQEMYYKENN